MTAFDSLSYRKYLFPRAMSQAEMFAAWLLTWGSYGKENTVKNKFFTDKFCAKVFLTLPKFAGVGSMEDYYEIQKFIYAG